MGNSRRTARTYENNLLIFYNCVEAKYEYPKNVEQYLAARFDHRPLFEILKEDGVASEQTIERLKECLRKVEDEACPQVSFVESHLKRADGNYGWYCIGFVPAVPGKMISITVTDITEELEEIERSGRDPLTGLLQHNTFCDAVEGVIRKDEKGILEGDYAMVCFDVIRFKAVNDIFGNEGGDRLLKHIAQIMNVMLKPGDFSCRSNADRFVFFTKTSGKELGVMVDELMNRISAFDIPFEIMCNMGIYITGDMVLPAGMMVDRALLAQSTIKGSYTTKVSYYQESLRAAMLTEQDILSIAGKALEEKQFVLYFQPQYDHADGTIIGAEALVRWKHPERGLISPGIFIPIFEKNAYISRLDFYVFEQACDFLKRCREKGIPQIPISTNFCRHDFYLTDFAEKLEEIRKRYDVPAELLRVEITESAIMGGSDQVNEMIKRLHSYGYIVEMDDFGSGYSSLNVLKDIEMDVIKLDMLFLSAETNNSRGGTILSAVVRMAKWLKVPVIAEGVETLRQADFLQSIGCNYIQGYLYSRPLPEYQYVELLTDSSIGKINLHSHSVEKLNSSKFWDPRSQETLIFSNYVGGAAVFDYHEGKLEVLRVNKKYLKELDMNLTEKDIIEMDLLETLDEANRKIYLDTINRAIETMEEQECDTWRTMFSRDCGEVHICVRSNMQVIAKNDASYLFYAMIHNVTNDVKHYMERLEVSLEKGVVPPEVHSVYHNWRHRITEVVNEEKK